MTNIKKIIDFSPKDIAIQIMKAIEVADISDFNGKNVFEADAYDDIFNAIVYGIEESNKLAHQAGIQDGREEVLKKAKKLHYEYLKGIKVRETLPANLAEIYTLGIDDYYHFLSSKE
jgi:hypothetical protein